MNILLPEIFFVKLSRIGKVLIGFRDIFDVKSATWKISTSRSMFGIWNISSGLVAVDYFVLVLNFTFFQEMPKSPIIPYCETIESFLVSDELCVPNNLSLTGHRFRNELLITNCSKNVSATVRFIEPKLPSLPWDMWKTTSSYRYLMICPWGQLVIACHICVLRHFLCVNKSSTTLDSVTLQYQAGSRAFTFWFIKQSDSN